MDGWFNSNNFWVLIIRIKNKEERYSRVPRNKNKEERNSRVPRLKISIF